MTPHNPQVEESVIGQLLAHSERIPEVTGTLLEPRHFYTAANRLLYEAISDAFYDGTPVDPLTVGELHAVQLSKLWALDEVKAIERVKAMARAEFVGDVADHARLVKRDADYRDLLATADDVRGRVAAEHETPEQIAGALSQQAMKIATSALSTTETVSFADAGREYVRTTREARLARAQGIEIGAYFGIPAIDRFTRGLRAGNVLIAAGEPGVGKTAVWGVAHLNFARRQMRRPEGTRVGTTVLSLEMGAEEFNGRFAAMLAGLDTSDIREGSLSDADFERSVEEWKKLVDLPLRISYAPSLRASQMRALLSEEVRKHNTGLVMIDHFGYFHLDRRLQNRTEEEGEKARFLKELAAELGVAIVCLAHTRKPEPGSNGVPRLSDLRGSQEIAAHAAFVGFIFRPWLYATDRERDAGKVDETEARMIWAKSRHGLSGSGSFVCDLARMYVS